MGRGVDGERGMVQLQPLRLFESLGYRLSVCPAGALARVDEPVHRVIGHRTVHEFFAVVLIDFLVTCEYRRHFGVVEVRMVDPERTLHRGSGDLVHKFGIAVAADDRHFKSKFLRLLDGERHILAHTGQEEQVGAGVLDRRQLSAEVDVRLAESFVGNYLSAELFIALDEKLAKSLRVVRTYVIEDGGLLQSKILKSEVGGKRSLIGVCEADTE